MGLNFKAEYVKRQGRTRQHHCHWPGCVAQCPPAMWGCKKHWYTLPQYLRNKVWAVYRPGQEVDMRPSEAYMKVAQEVQDWIAAYLEGRILTGDTNKPTKGKTRRA